MQHHQTTRLTIQKQRAADKLRLRLYKIQVVRVCVFFLTASRKKLIKKINFSLPDARAHTQYYVSLVRDGRGRSGYLLFPASKTMVVIIIIIITKKSIPTDRTYIIIIIICVLLVTGRTNDILTTNERCGVVTIQYLYIIPWPFPTKGLLAHGTGKCSRKQQRAQCTMHIIILRHHKCILFNYYRYISSIYMQIKNNIMIHKYNCCRTEDTGTLQIGHRPKVEICSRFCI